VDSSGSEVVNPATGEVVARVPASTVEETDAAIERARGAFDRPVTRIFPENAGCEDQ
jgi:acyl-CoA reductase-like NAD-dependent aldehyde dehydrogenase